jgi:peptidoglycan hydrolase-like protein with peptidoglycan-binding domain
MLQTLLIEQAKGLDAQELGRVGATGYFGSYTQKALSEYQRLSGILPSAGYFGPITRAQMTGAGVGWW